MERIPVLPFTSRTIVACVLPILIFWNIAHTQDTSYTSKHGRIEQPLKKFLKTPVRSFSVSKDQGGCFHFGSSSIQYTKKANGTFSTNEIGYSSSFWGRSLDSISFYQNQVLDKEINSFLTNLSNNFWNQPKKEDFEINDTAILIFNDIYEEVRKSFDVKDTWASKDIQLEGSWLSFFLNRKLEKKSFKAANILYSINDSLINESFQSHGSSTNWCNYELTFINENGDTLVISHGESDKFLLGESWYNPWTITVEANFFQIRNLSIPKFFLRATPKGWMLSKNALNAQFLFTIGYLLSLLD